MSNMPGPGAYKLFQHFNSNKKVGCKFASKNYDDLGNKRKRNKIGPGRYQPRTKNWSK